MQHYFPNVPELGNVALSRHCQAKMVQDGITETQFTAVLLSSQIPVVPDGFAVSTKTGNGIRIVLLNRPEPFRGAKLVKTVFRVQAQANAQSKCR